MFIPEHHGTILPVKREVVDQDWAGTSVDGRRDPGDTAIRVDQGIYIQCHLKLAINTAEPTEMCALHPGQGIRSETESFSPYIVGVVGYRMVTLEGYYCSFMVGVVEVV